MDRTVQGLSSHFVWTNRSKESLALDVKHPRAKEILERLKCSLTVVGGYHIIASRGENDLVCFIEHVFVFYN